MCEERRAQREAIQVNIWELSPPYSDDSRSPSRSPSPKRSRNDDHEEEEKRKKKSKGKKNSRSDEDDSGDEKKSKSKKSKKDKKSKKSKKNKKSKSKKKKESSSSSSSSPSPSSSSSASESEDEKESKEEIKKDSKKKPKLDETVENEKEKFKELWEEKKVDDSVDQIVGPLPLPKLEIPQNTKDKESSFGKALLPGEGSAMANYIKSGKRIPRRGEIGLESEEIESFENVGYVMSGSRHRRMNAVRIRKENQVISAEEKSALLAFNLEQKAKKENEIIAGFRDLVQEKIRERSTTPSDED